MQAHLTSNVRATQNFFAVGEVASTGGCDAAPIWPHGALRSSFWWSLINDVSDSISPSQAVLTSRCRSTQVKLYTGLIASIDLWPQEVFTFSEMLALVQSESSFGAYVCNRRPAGLHSDQRSCRLWSPLAYGLGAIITGGAPWPTALGAINRLWSPYAY